MFANCRFHALQPCFFLLIDRAEAADQGSDPAWSEAMIRLNEPGGRRGGARSTMSVVRNLRRLTG